MIAKYSLYLKFIHFLFITFEAFLSSLVSYFSGTSSTPMVNIHPNYELLEEIPAEEHLGEFEL
jgi:hypothetical protein